MFRGYIRAMPTQFILHTDGAAKGNPGPSGIGIALYKKGDEDGAGASCNTSGINTYFVDGTTPVRCKVKPFWDFDGRFSYNVTSNLQAYVNVSNLFDRPAPLDPATYGGYQYNPAWANDGIYGRYFKVGLRATF